MLPFHFPAPLPTATLSVLLPVALTLTACAGVQDPARTTSQPVAAEPAGPDLPDPVGTLPSVESTTVTGQPFVVPTDFTADWNIVLLAFTREQQAEVDTWAELGVELEQRIANVRYYEIPVLPEMEPAMRKRVNMGMRIGLASNDVRTRAVTLFLEREPFLEPIGIESTETAHVLFVDREGQVYLRRAGPRSDEVEAELMQLVDEVARPRPESESGIWETLEADSRFSNLLEAVDGVRLGFLLTGDEPITLFAPTDAAFATLAGGEPDELMDDQARLRALVTRHIVHGYVDRDTLAARERVFSVSLNELPLVGQPADGGVEVAGVRIVDSIECTNGVIHVLDRVLPEPEAKADADGQGG